MIVYVPNPRETRARSILSQLGAPYLLVHEICENLLLPRRQLAGVLPNTLEKQEAFSVGGKGETDQLLRHSVEHSGTRCRTHVVGTTMFQGRRVSRTRQHPATIRVALSPKRRSAVPTLYFSHGKMATPVITGNFGNRVGLAAYRVLPIVT